MSDATIYALAYCLSVADIFATSVLAYWLGCKIFEAKFDLKKAAAAAALVLLLKNV